MTTPSLAQMREAVMRATPAIITPTCCGFESRLLSAIDADIRALRAVAEIIRQVEAGELVPPTIPGCPICGGKTSV